MGLSEHRAKQRRKLSPNSLANLKMYKKGQSGNPGGRPKSKLLSQAYRRALEEMVKGETNADVIADRIIRLAKGDIIGVPGQVQAAQHIAERTEGSTATIIHSGTVEHVLSIKEKQEAAESLKRIAAFREEVIDVDNEP